MFVSIQAPIHALSFSEPVLCAVIFAAMFRSGEHARFRPLAYYVALKGVTALMCSALTLPAVGHDVLAYATLFYTYWLSQMGQGALALFAIYSVFQTAMAPMKGLRWLGGMVFRWVAVVSLVVALGLSFGPKETTSAFIMIAASQFQRTASILTLCLLLFVCFTVRPLGLSFRSRIFGIMLGLGILSTAGLVESAWLLSMSTTMYNWLNIVNGGAVCASLSIWAVYFIVQEPKRRFILLPTTSPFHKWNQISLALGADPGYVAVGGVGPEAFAPAELEFMRIASQRMRESDVQTGPELFETASSVA